MNQNIIQQHLVIVFFGPISFAPLRKASSFNERNFNQYENNSDR